jgi:hypothetical protein
MRVWLCGVVVVVTGCAGLQPIKLHTPGPTPRVDVVRGPAGLHRIQYEDDASGRLRAQVAMESFCGGPVAVAREGELATVTAYVLVGGVVLPINARPSAKRWSFAREAHFRCRPLEL